MLASNAIYSFGILQIIPEIQIRSDQTFPECKKTDKQTCFITTDIFSTFILIFLLHLRRTDCVKICYIIDYGGTFLKKILQLK